VSQGFMETLARTFQNVFVVALKMGAPMIAVLLFIHAAFGIIARTVPRINLLVAGFPLTIGAGLLTLGVALPYVEMLIRRVFGQLGHDIMILLENRTPHGEKETRDP
jgi:flagellar biosynthetic protein FliR